MARANRAASDPRGFGLDSFSGQVQGEGMDRSTVDGAEQLYRYTFDKEIHYQAPAQVRVDECVTPANMPRQCHVIVSDGTTGWLYLPDLQQAAHFSAGPDTGIRFVAADQRSLVTTPGKEPPVRLVGTETVAGRPTYVLEIAPVSAPATAIASSKVWIDQQFHIELRHEAHDQRGNVITAWSYTRFTPNPGVDAALFRFSPPAGVPVEEGYPLNTNTLYITPELRFVVQGRAER